MNRVCGWKYLILLLLIAVTLAGCKLAIIVVEGGEVHSTGSGVCVAGTVCVIEVTHTNFTDTFTAVPHEGWYFAKWHSGDGFWCAGLNDPACPVSSAGAEGRPAWEALIASSEVFYLMPIFRMGSPITDTIIVEGKEWAQVDLFSNLTWNDIDAVCPQGVCAGTLNGYNISGWRWASVDDLNALFNYYIGIEALGPGPDSYSEGHNSEWVIAFFDDGWRDQLFQGSYISVFGRVRDSAAFTAGLVDSWTPGMGSGGDMVFTNEDFTHPAFSENAGAWFYRVP